MIKYLPVVLLAGCASLAPAGDDELIIPAVAPAIVSTCPDLPLPEEAMNLGDLMNYTKDIMILYIECANKHDALVNAAGSKIKLSK